MIERRGNSWRARYRGPDRRERSKSFKRKSDAERWLGQQRSLMAQGDWTDPARGRITFGEYAEAWLESRADLKPKTRHQYQALMRKHINPTWRTVPLAKITFETLTHWVSQLSQTGLGPSAIRQSVFVMSAALDHAVRSGRIRSNPARGLGLPRPKRRDYVFLTHGQVLTLADAAGNWRLLILVLAYTGLRWGEATALRVCDIDFDRRRIDVRRAFSDVGGRVVLGTPKSHQSRTVPLPRFVAVELAAGVGGKRPDDLVFTMPGGSVMRLSNWRLVTFKPARTRAGLSDRFRIHDLRHTAASLMKVSGVASDATFREKREDTRPALQLPRPSQRAGRLRQQSGDDLRCHHPVASTERMLQPLPLHPVTPMLRQMQRKAQRRGRMPLPPARQAQVFGRVGKPLPTSFQAGYPPKMLQEIMGHASITTTLDLYGHLYPGEMDRYADRLDQAATNGDAAKMRPDDDVDEPDTT